MACAKPSADTLDMCHAVCWRISRSKRARFFHKFELPMVSQAFCLLASFLPLAISHRSIPSGGTTCFNQFNSPETALTLPNSKVSWGSSRIFTCENPIFWLDAQVDADQTLAFTVTVPELERFAPVRMTVAFLAPGLPMTTDATNVPEEIIAYQEQAGLGIMVVKSPQDQSTCSHVQEVMGNASTVKDGRCHFFEPFGGSNSWVVLDDELVTPEAGEIKIAMYSEDGTTAKAGFAGLDWPEDFITPYDIPVSNCTFCGTSQDTNPAYSDLYSEQRDMEGFGGFPAFVSCADVTEPLMPDEAQQCPPIVDSSAVIEQPESCDLGCGIDGTCHSHNVFGECTHVVEWDLAPKVGAADVKELVIFKGDVVQFKYTGNGNAHNLFLMKDGDALEQCDFTDAGELANVVAIKVGHPFTFEEAGLYHFACGIGCTGFGEEANPDEEVEQDPTKCHCNVGQKVTVEVKDASDGLRCHDHEYKGASTDEVEPLQCGDSEVVVKAIDNADYMAGGATKCAEFCTPAFALAFMEGVVEGSCATDGYLSSPEMHSVTLPNSPAAIEVRVTDLEGSAAKTNCHCHSFEEISCPEQETAEDTLYAEHIDEIEEFCQGILDGTEEVCPYKCFQPIEVLHLHYLECPTRVVDPTYLAVNATDLCHKAAEAPAGNDCPVVDLAAPPKNVETTTNNDGDEPSSGTSLNAHILSFAAVVCILFLLG